LEISAVDVVAVVTEVGAGLRSFTVGGRHYVEPFPADALPFAAAGAVLVPWPNRVAGGRWSWNGAVQQLALTEPEAGNAIHGLLRHSFYDVVERADDAVTLGARVAAQPGWPVPLATEVRYAVAADGLTVTHTLRNLGGAAVPFGVGTHPYLRVADLDTDDCSLVLAATTALPLEESLPTGPARPVEGDDDFRRGRALRGLVLDDAFGGCLPAEGDTLVRHRLLGPDGGVELWADPDFRWVQVFTLGPVGGRRSVAVEPMTCPPDALNSGTDLLTLEPGDTWRGSWGVRPI
jgi:aldose 1-epimerase